MPGWFGGISDDAILLLRFLLRVGYVKMLEAVVRAGALVDCSLRPRMPKNSLHTEYLPFLKFIKASSVCICNVSALAICSARICPSEHLTPSASRPSARQRPPSIAANNIWCVSRRPSLLICYKPGDSFVPPSNNPCCLLTNGVSRTADKLPRCSVGCTGKKFFVSLLD